MHRLAKKISVLSLALLPYVIIAGLLIIALFIKPKAIGETISPPPIERRDRFFGVVAPEKNVIWATGSIGKVIRSDDEGKTFVLQNTHTTVNLQDIAAWDARRALALDLVSPSTRMGWVVPWVPPLRCKTDRAGLSSETIFCCKTVRACSRASGLGGQPVT